MSQNVIAIIIDGVYRQLWYLYFNGLESYCVKITQILDITQQFPNLRVKFAFKADSPSDKIFHIGSSRIYGWNRKDINLNTGSNLQSLCIADHSADVGGKGRRQWILEMTS